MGLHLSGTHGGVGHVEPAGSTSITELLTLAGSGDPAARDRLWAVVYGELHRMAASCLAGERAAARMQPTTLVHEAYLRLCGNHEAAWANRRHFFAAAANSMRQILVDDARKRGRLKRGGGRATLSLDRTDPTERGLGPTGRHLGPPRSERPLQEPSPPVPSPSERCPPVRGAARTEVRGSSPEPSPSGGGWDAADLLAVDEALDRLEQTDPRKAEVVMLRYFAGLSVGETAAAMGLSPRTVDSEWRFARAWLRRALAGLE